MQMMGNSRGLLSITRSQSQVSVSGRTPHRSNNGLRGQISFALERDLYSYFGFDTVALAEAGG
jgi:hypothetical protein